MNTLVNRWTSADDVTPAELTDALRDGGVLSGEASVTSFTHESVGVGVGILALLWRLDVTYEPALSGPRTIILKLPHSSAEVRAVPHALRFYEREIGFYANVAGTTPIGTPRCYWSSFDPETNDFVLLLEDISALEQHDQLRGCPIDDARVAILGIAAHHAACWERDDVLNATWTGPVDEIPMPQAIHQMLVGRIPILADRLGDELPPGTIAIVERIRDELEPLLARFTGGPLTLLHGDYRLDNIFFTPAPEREVVVIDWQIATIGGGAYDVGYLMAQSVQSDARKASERGLLREYHDALGALGVTGYSVDDAWDDYRRTILWSLVYAAGVISDDLTNVRAIELAKTMATRSAVAIADLDATEMFDR
jgi:hypothetical protein